MFPLFSLQDETEYCPVVPSWVQKPLCVPNFLFVGKNAFSLLDPPWVPEGRFKLLLIRGVRRRLFAKLSSFGLFNIREKYTFILYELLSFLLLLVVSKPNSNTIYSLIILFCIFSISAYYYTYPMPCNIKIFLGSHLSGQFFALIIHRKTWYLCLTYFQWIFFAKKLLCFLIYHIATVIAGYVP